MSLPPINRRGFMLCFSSPSGAGKTSICKYLLDSDPRMCLSISVTTRPPRPGETDGKDYTFVSLDTFHEMVDQGEFLEWAKVFDNYYGTPKKTVFDALREGRDVVFDIDWQGTQQVAQLARTDLVSIFILPPNLQELENRLRLRAQDNDTVIQKRMREATNEMSHWPEYDYVIVNENLQQSVKEVQSIITAERLRRTRQLGLVDFVNTLRNYKKPQEI